MSGVLVVFWSRFPVPSRRLARPESRAPGTLWCLLLEPEGRPGDASRCAGAWLPVGRTIRRVKSNTGVMGAEILLCGLLAYS